MKYKTKIISLVIFFNCLFQRTLLGQECTVNLIVVYTNEAADSLGGNQQAVAQIIAAVQSMNTSFIYSEVSHSINLVRTIRLTDFESGCFASDLNSFQANAQIDSLRNKYHADVAALVLMNNEFCGLPYIDDELASSTTAYCAVNFSCLLNSFALSHQVAHLYGCSHYIEVRGEDNNAPYSYGHGYHWSFDGVVGFSTILGVNDDYFCTENGLDNEDNCNIIPYFSNPSITYRNVPLGYPGVHNNAAVLNMNAGIIGSFKTVPNVQNSLIDSVEYFDIAKASAMDTLSTGAFYIIRDSAIVEFIAKDRIVLNPGFKAEAGVYFKTILDEPPKECKK